MMVMSTLLNPDQVPGLIDQFQKEKTRNTSSKIFTASRNFGLNNFCKYFMLTGVFG